MTEKQKEINDNFMKVRDTLIYAQNAIDREQERQDDLLFDYLIKEKEHDDFFFLMTKIFVFFVSLSLIISIHWVFPLIDPFLINLKTFIVGVWISALISLYSSIRFVKYSKEWNLKVDVSLKHVDMLLEESKNYIDEMENLKKEYLNS